MLKTIPTLLFILSVHIACLAQGGKGTVKGRILSSDSLPAAYVPIGLKGTSIGTTTDANGQYSFKAPTGTHTLIIQFVGHEAEEKTIEVKEGETTQVEDFSLRENAKELQEVVVEGNRNKFANKESDYVARLPLKDLENPQVYSTISKELMKEQVVTSFDDAVKNAPGLNKLWTSTGRGSDGAAYFSLRGFSVQPSMINGIAGVTNGGLDPANMEKIEVIKGPAGTLFGSSLVSYGGLINIVTKKPYEKFGGEVSYTGGSYGLSRVTADVNTPINKEKTVLFRLNTAYHYEGTFQDVGFKRSIFIAPSLSYKASKRLSFLFNAEYFNSEGTNPLMVFLNRTRPYIAKSPNELTTDFRRSYTSNDLTIKNPNFTMYGQMNYKLSDKWTAQTNLARSVKKSDGYYQYVMYQSMLNDTSLTRYVSDQNSTTTVTDLQQNFIGDFEILGLRNRMVLGVDYLHNQTMNNSTAYMSDNLNTAWFDDRRYGQLTQQFVDAKLGANTAPTRNTASSETYSAYVSEVLNITNNLLMMASMRFDYFKSKGSYNHRTNLTTGFYEQIALSPKFGIIYQIVKDKVSLFGNYMNGYQNVAPANASDQPVWASVVFKPQQANQLEGGIKLDLFAHKLAFTASYYDIYVNNVTRSIPWPDNAGRSYTVQDASTKSKGVEVDVIANPIPGLNVIAGWSFNESKYLRAGSTAEGLRPTAAGPEQLANAWVSYTLGKGKLQGLGAGLGGNYTSENKISYNTLTGTFVIPAYTVLNASLFYDTPAYRLGLKVNNLTDEVYYTGWSTVERQMPVRYMASVTVKF